MHYRISIVQNFLHLSLQYRIHFYRSWYRILDLVLTRTHLHIRPHILSGQHPAATAKPILGDPGADSGARENRNK